MHKIYLHLEKGGTGRSHCVYHLAWVLGELFNKKVLIIDLDAQKNLSFLFGLDGNTIVAEGGCSMAHVLFKNLNPNKERKSIRECIIKDIAPNVDIAYSCSEMSEAESQILQEKYNNHLLLTNALKEIEDEYDYAFIDTDGTYNRLFINSAVASDLIIPTMKTDMLNAQCLVETMKNLNSLLSDGFDFDIGGVLCTTYENTSHDNQVLEYLKSNDFDIWGVIKKQVAIKDAPVENKPIYRHSPSNQGSWACIRVAHKILSHFGEDFAIPLDKRYRRKKDY